jgi:hypothetical protein
MLQEHGAGSAPHLEAEESEALLAHKSFTVEESRLNVPEPPVATQVKVPTIPVSPYLQPVSVSQIPFRSSSSSSSLSFHDVVMSYKDNMHSPELKAHLSEITLEKFHELKESSVELILPLIVAWLRDPVSKSLAFVCLWEAAKTFPSLFGKLQHRALVSKCITAIEEMQDCYDFPLSIEELTQLREFLLHHLQTPTSAFGW